MRKILITLLLTILLISPVLADIGPKPSVDIHLTYEGKGIMDEAFGARMLLCGAQEEPNECEQDPGVGDYSHRYCEELRIAIPDEERECTWIPARMAWGGDPCTASQCRFGYMIPQEFRLAVYLPSREKLFVSPAIKRENFRSAFEAELSPDGTISISETTSLLRTNLAKNIGSFLIALAFTLIIELLIATLYFKIAKIPLKLLHWVLLINLITLPFVWFLFPLIWQTTIAVIIGELFAFITEPIMLHYFSKKRVVWKHAIILCFLANLASFLIGGFLLIFFYFMF